MCIFHLHKCFTCWTDWTSHCTMKRFRFLVCFNLIALTGFIYFHFLLNTSSYSPPLKENTPIHSTCSFKSDLRGKHQKVIGYSLYPHWKSGNIDRRYTGSLVINAQKVAEIYHGRAKQFCHMTLSEACPKTAEDPSLQLWPLWRYYRWTIRVYHNLTSAQLSQQPEVQKIARFSNVDLCNVTKILTERNQTIKYAKTWRFLPAVDEYVDYFLSRDTDSPVLQREVDAVSQWIDSNLTFHTMRDNPFHCIPFLGGLWGARLVGDYERKMVRKIVAKILFGKHRQFSAAEDDRADQSLLTEHLWTEFAWNNTMEHDSYCCKIFFQSHPFPTQRNGSYFVGMILDPASKEMPKRKYKCPQECRPNDHQDWIYC